MLEHLGFNVSDSTGEQRCSVYVLYVCIYEFVFLADDSGDPGAAFPPPGAGEGRSN